MSLYKKTWVTMGFLPANFLNKNIGAAKVFRPRCKEGLTDEGDCDVIF